MLKLTDFYADWCGPCQTMKPILEEFIQEMKGGLQIEKINVDQNQTLAQQKRVLSIPTYILDRDGQEIERKMGVMSKEALKDWITSHL